MAVTMYLMAAIMYLMAEPFLQLKLTGKFNISNLDNDWSEAIYKGMKGSPVKYSFEQMNELAKLFKGDILYK